jgi:CRISPR-associated endoribonuclease Cas6
MEATVPVVQGGEKMFVAMTLQLHQRDHRVLTVADGIYAHAAILSAITAESQTMAQTLHDMQRDKRITIAIVSSDHHSATLRLTFAHQDGLAYAETLANSLMTCPTLRLGQTLCEVQSVDLTDPQWGGISTWADLTATPAGRYMSFQFVTPAAITKRGDNGDKFISLYPNPIDLFGGLAKRWQAWEGAELPAQLDDYVRTGGCVISSYRLETVEFQTRERTQVAFVGWAMYECRKNKPDYIAALNALARLAYYTGVGYQTARGMGAVKTKISN